MGGGGERLLLRALAAVEKPLLTLRECNTRGRNVAQGGRNGTGVGMCI